MCADLIRFADSPPTIGGLYEEEVIEKLCNGLPDQFVILANPSFPTLSSFFYEYDIIVLHPFICEVIEVKCLYHIVNVYEDWLEGINKFHVHAIFSTLETKCKVLKSKFVNNRDMLHWDAAPRIKSRVLVGPEETEIQYKYAAHRTNNKVMKLHDAIKSYRDADKDSRKSFVDIQEWTVFKQRLSRYSEKLKENPRTKDKIGKYFIKRCVGKTDVNIEYWANDEPPCKVDVYLREFPFDPTLGKEDTERYISEVTRGMQVLRKLRHQFIQCVIGHFQTGCSLVQVSDWFDGRALEDSWKESQSLNLNDKIGLMIKVAEGLSYCHSRGVFHRNLNAKNILTNDELDDIRITGFEFAKDLAFDNSLTGSRLNLRDPAIIPPEELLSGGTLGDINYRLYDIYQAGLLFYRILENGEWPFKTSFDYAMGVESIREANVHRGENGFEQLIEMVFKMLDVKPQDRVDPMQRVEDTLNHLMVTC